MAEGFDVSFKLYGMSEALGKLRTYRKVIPTADEDAARTLAHEVEEIFRQAAPKGRGDRSAGSQPFADSIHAQVEARGYGSAVSLVTSQPTLRKWLKEGTRGREIVPRSKKALAWEGISHPVARVHFPGTKPNPWEDQAQAEAKSTVIDEYPTLIKKAFPSS